MSCQLRLLTLLLLANLKDVRFMQRSMAALTAIFNIIEPSDTRPACAYS